MNETKVDESFKDLLLTLIKKVEAVEKPHVCEYKAQIAQQTIDIAVIKETLLSLRKEDTDHEKWIDTHVKQGDGWRKAIITIVVTLIIYGCGFIYNWATMNNEVSHLKNSISSISVDVNELKRTSIGYNKYRSSQEVLINKEKK